MYTQTDKTSVNSGKIFPGTISPKENSDEQTHQIEDNRAVSIIQRAFQEKVHEGPQSKHLAEFQEMANSHTDVTRSTSRSSANSVIQRQPYAINYTESKLKTILNQSEGRASPVTGTDGHPRQHAGNLKKAVAFAEEQGKTKSVFKNTAIQDKAVTDAINQTDGQNELANLDINPAVATRTSIENVPIEPAEVIAVKAKKKKGAARGVVKTWETQTGNANNATIVVDSTGTNIPGDIHIQSAYPVL
jgi:hypothetical protein